jgi:hypothetical protein
MTMPSGSSPRSPEAVRRKLRALAALVTDKGATPPERSTAADLKARLEQRLETAGEPNGDRTDGAFRFGRVLRGVAQSTAPRVPKGDWTDGALRLGKALRRGYKRWLSN